MAQRPGHARSDLGVVVRVGEHPRRRTLEHGELLGVGRHRGHDLEGAGSGPDDRHPLAGQIGPIDPPGRVHGQPGEVVAPVDVGELGPVELAHRADQRVGLDDLAVVLDVAVGGCRRLQLDRPAGAVFVPDRSTHLGGEADVVGHPVALEAVLEVGLQLGLAGEVLAPVVVGRERVRVEVVAHVHPGAWIAVLVPGAAHPGVLLDHRVGDPGLAQPDGGQQPGHAGADDHHVEGPHAVVVGAGPVGPGHGSGVDPVELELLADQAQVLIGHRLRSTAPASSRPAARRRVPSAERTLRRGRPGSPRGPGPAPRPAPPGS